MDSGRVNAAGDIIGTLSARVSELTKRVAMLQAELESANKRLAVYEEHDATIQDALSTALKSAYEIRQRAEIASGQLLEQAREERRMLLSEIARLRDERDAVQEEIAAQRRSSISAVTSRPLSSDNAAAELRAVASEALKGLFQEIVDEIRTTERSARAAEASEAEARERQRREAPRPHEPVREEPLVEAARPETPHVAEMPRTEPPQMIETPTYEAMKRIRRMRVTEDEDVAPQRADFAQTAEAVDAILSLDETRQAPAITHDESVAEPEPVAHEVIVAPEPVAEPEPVATPEPIAEADVAESDVAEAAPLEELEEFAAPAAIEPEPTLQEPEPILQEPEPILQEAAPFIEAAPQPEPVAEAGPEPVAEAEPEPAPQRPAMDWRTEVPAAEAQPQEQPSPWLPTSFADVTEEAPTRSETAPAEPTLPTSFATAEPVAEVETEAQAETEPQVGHDPRLAALGHAAEPEPARELRPPLEVVHGPVEVRETHQPRVEAAAPTSDIQLVLSPIPSFPRLVEIERRIQSLPVVRTLYVRDFRAGAATLAVTLRSTMTPEEFASILAGLQQPRLRLVAGARNTLELRIEGEAGVA